MTWSPSSPAPRDPAAVRRDSNIVFDQVGGVTGFDETVKLPAKLFDVEGCRPVVGSSSTG
jgi:hypothetical protein